MCGIVGVLNLKDLPPVDAIVLRQMLAMIQHRGPDGFGIYRDASAGLGSARLSIIDLRGGWQPIGNEDGTLWMVFNGEIFNYVELRPELEARGHRFSTHSDTEVILHLYEDYGSGNCLNYLNGQFAIALWDSRQQSLLLARDRLGVRPLFYTVKQGQLIFGSEIKSILVYPGMRAEIDPVSLGQVFTYWSPLSPRTAFQGIYEVPPAHYLLAKEGSLDVHPYWSLDFAEEAPRARKPDDYLEEFESLLIDAARIRLRADVPVGAYLSGGLDSSITTAIIRKYFANRLDTFSIAFDDPEFDESRYQQQMAGFLGTDHRVVHCSHADIAHVFPDVVWHTEVPLLRTAPAPMFLLSGLVNEHGLKVVLTGEGADEFLAGYDIFKEMAIRRFWAKAPSSQIRPLLLRRIYPDITALGSTSGAYLAAFFKRGLADTASPFYSHAIRWGNTARMQRFLRLPCKNDYTTDVALPRDFGQWSPLAQAQYLEIEVFFSEYLLCSQGDRMSMAHSVEGRFPFLDYRLVEFCNHLPSTLKLHGLTEKWLLKQMGCKLLPDAIWQRVKRPYRAPVHRSFFGGTIPEYVTESVSEANLCESGLFVTHAVRQLFDKATTGAHMTEVEDMTLVGIISTQLLYHQFVKAFRSSPLQSGDNIKVVDRTAAIVGSN